MIYTVLDIESSGLSKIADDILEVGYIKIDSSNTVLDAGEMYFYKPQFRVESAQHIHGLTRQYLSQFEDQFDTNLAKLYTMCYNGILVGKNSTLFDMPFIVNFIQRYSCLKDMKCMGTYDMQDIIGQDYRNWHYRTFGTRTNKDGKLMEQVIAIGKTEEDVKKLYKEVCKEGSRDAYHGGLYDACATKLLLDYALANNRLVLQ